MVIILILRWWTTRRCSTWRSLPRSAFGSSRRFSTETFQSSTWWAHSQLSSIHSQLSSIIHNYHQLFTIIINLSQLSSIFHNYHQLLTTIINSFIHNHPQPFNPLGSMSWAEHSQSSSWKDNVWDNSQLSLWEDNVRNATKVLSDNISLHCNYLANPSSTAQTVWFRYLLRYLILGENKFTMPNNGTNQLSLW